MGSVWLVAKREFLQRVRTKWFVILTLLMPAFVVGSAVIPARLMSMKSEETRVIAVVTARPELASALQQQLGAGGKHDIGAPQFKVVLHTSTSDETDRELRDEVNAGKLDGYLWLSEDALRSRVFPYNTSHASNFLETQAIRAALRSVITKSQLESRGITAAEADEMLKPVEIETVAVTDGKKSKSSEVRSFFLPFLLMTMMYVSLVMYGMAVMRSVLEEKSTRVVEVLLSSITSQELLAGKIIGVAAVGVLQMTIWTLFGAIGTAPAMRSLQRANVSHATLVFFPVFFLCGHLLYSIIYAAVGALVNSDEEAQQLQWPVLMPIFTCIVLAAPVIREPNSAMAFWLSIFPLTSPLIMFVRVCVQMPPAWQLVTCFVLLIAAVYAALWICTRIFRVGILMYGKRPTLTEIRKWIRYA